MKPQIGSKWAEYHDYWTFVVRGDFALGQRRFPKGDPVAAHVGSFAHGQRESSIRQVKSEWAP